MQTGAIAKVQYESLATGNMNGTCAQHLHVLLLELLARDCRTCSAVQSRLYLKPMLPHARQCPEQDRPPVPRRTQKQGHAARLQPSADSLEDLPPMPLPVQEMQPIQQAPCPLHQALQPGLTGVTAQAGICRHCAVHPGSRHVAGSLSRLSQCSSVHSAWDQLWDMLLLNQTAGPR